MEVDFTQVEKERLPNLYEVLLRQTSAPIDLWSFYAFLSQFPYAIDFLDFWIDLMSHIRLCRDYVKGVRDSIRVRNGELPHSELPHSALPSDDSQAGTGESNDVLNILLKEGYLDFRNSKRVSQFLRGNIEESWMVSSNRSRRHTKASASEVVELLAETIEEMLKEETQREKRPKIMRKQLMHNAVEICRQYLLSPEESPRYLINVPDGMRTRTLHSVQNEGRFDPEVFDELRNLSYNFLEMDCFPKFLSRVSLHNLHDQLSDWRFQSTAAVGKLGRKSYGHRTLSPLSKYSALSRIALGLCWLGIGFWIGYVLIFLHYSRAIRVTTIVPFGIGCYFAICGIYQVDILYSWFGITQRLMYEKKLPADNMEESYTKTKIRVPTIFALLGGRSRLMPIYHPFVKKLLFRRGMWCTLIVVVLTASLTVLFSCVPGKRI